MFKVLTDHHEFLSCYGNFQGLWCWTYGCQRNWATGCVLFRLRLGRNP